MAVLETALDACPYAAERCRKNGGTLEGGQLDPDIAKLAQVFVVIGLFTASMLVMVFVARLAFFPRRRKALPADSELPRIDDSRFTRLEQAVDSIAIEVERIAEAQRFSVKLMSERLPNRLGQSVSEREPR